MPFILASASPQRIDLLTQIGRVPKQIVIPDIDETVLKGEKPKNLSCRLAYLKAKSVSDRYNNNFIVAADTVVCSGRRILEKTQCKNKAYNYLNILSGSKHRVYGGIAVIGPNVKRIRSVVTHVSFKKISDQEIELYLKTNEWKNKAGAYAIQGQGSKFIKRINGSYSNVVGLCLYTIESILGNLKELNYVARK